MGREENIKTFQDTERLVKEKAILADAVRYSTKNQILIPEYMQVKFGSKSLYLFSPEDVEKYRNELGIKEHSDKTIKEDFFEFLEERDYSLSYKMPFMLAFIKYINSIGDAKIDEVLDDYIAFYQDRLDRGLQIDRSTCPYNDAMLRIT